MSMQTSQEGDPGKLAYLHNPNWVPTPREHLGEVKAMRGTCMRCVFGEGQHAETCRCTVAAPDPHCSALDMEAASEEAPLSLPAIVDIAYEDGKAVLTVTPIPRSQPAMEAD